MTVAHFPHVPAAVGPQASLERLYSRCTVAAAAFFLTVEILYFAALQQPSFWRPTMDAIHAAVGRDFLNTWMGGRAALSGGPAAWFDWDVYQQAVHQILGPASDHDFRSYFWSYPPHVLLLIWPFGLMPYLLGYGVWCVVGLAAFVAVARAGGVERSNLLFVALAPAVAVNIFFGQNGFVTATLLVGGLICLDRRPILAGILFGILTIKPQLGLLLPVVLVMTGRWRTIAAAAATVAAMVAATAAIYGGGIWTEFLTKVGSQQVWLLNHASGLVLSQIPSALYAGRRLGLPLEIGWAVQIVETALAVAAVVWTFARRRDPVLSTALLVTAAFMVTPYSFNYDMVVFGWTLALLRQRSDNTALDHALILAMWALPVVMMVFGIVLHLPIAIVVLGAFAARLVWRLAQAAPATADQQMPAGLARA
jgi:hypothetical protein